jgi:hypothetical protein
VCVISSRSCPGQRSGNCREDAVFLVKDEFLGATHLVFTWQDPRKNGYVGDVVADVSLDYDMEAVHEWPEGAAAPEACVGRAPNDPKHYKVFRYVRDRELEGYQPVEGTADVFGSWSEYVRLRLYPPNPEKIDDEQWYDYLDRLDETARLRRQQAQASDEPTGRNRDEIAAWVAKKHFIVDSGIREVWYLPKAAPLDEIRLIELNDWLVGSEPTVEAVDFGLDVAGAHFRLLVADVNSEQLQQVKRDPSRLPAGWSLDQSQIWKRKGA